MQWAGALFGRFLRGVRTVVGGACGDGDRGNASRWNSRIALWACSWLLGVVSGLSEHLFWDVQRQGVDPERHAVWLARRVLEYGYWSDWQTLVAYYGKVRLAQIVVGIRSLNPRAFAFCRAWFQIPATDFRCSNTTPFP